MFSYEANSQNYVSESLLRFPLWYVLEEAPTIASEQFQSDSVFAPAISALQEITPFFISGLTYGWEFSYTPSDNLRGVKEYFELTEIFSVNIGDENLHFADTKIEDGVSKVETWVEYHLSPRMMWERERWYTSAFPSVGGKGETSVFDGANGIIIACESAAKNALREYARSLIKNKPKEITGKILLTDFPRYYIDAGKYVADLDFFLNVSKIVEYTYF